MRVAALYDVHGNLAALEAVLAEVQRADADVVLVGGDVAIGPEPRGCVELLLALGERALFVRGNGDRELTEGPDGEGLWAERTRWAAAQLDEAHLAFLAGLPLSASLAVDGLGPTLFCHGSPRSDEEILTAISPEGRVAAALAGVAEEVVVCGHTHVQYDRRAAGKRVVNPGSVGMPYADRPGAYWALLGPGVDMRRTEYDLEAVAAAIRATGYPDAGEHASENVLAVPGAREATEHFERLAHAADASR